MATTVTLKPNAIDLSGSTSGTTTLQATAVAGTTTITLPAATDTLVGKATTDTLTNKTLTAPTLASANITTALTLTGAAGTNGQYLTSAGSGLAPTWTTVASSQWTTSGANIYYTTGSVGIGTTSPNAPLEVFKTSNKTAIFGNATANNGNYITLAGNSTNKNWVITTNMYVGGEFAIGRTSATGGTDIGTTPDLTITSSGRVGIGTTSPAGPLGVSGTGAISTFTQTAGGDYCITTKPFDNGGTYYAMAFYAVSQVGAITSSTSATTYATSSDYRLKENIAPMTGALAKVAQLKPVTFKWKIDGSDAQGFIAHELQEVMPDAVTGSKDATREEEYEVTPAIKDELGNVTTPAVMDTRTIPVHQGVDTSFLVATLTAAIQELKAINDTLTARIVALETR